MGRLTHPGTNSHKVICDVCGFQLYANEAVLITERLSTQYGLLVCPKDVDKVNPQTYLRGHSEQSTLNPRMARPERDPKYGFIDRVGEITTGDTSDPSGRTAGAPRNPQFLSVTTTQTEFIWHGPEDPGSSRVTGFKIERESPVGGGFSDLVANTNSIAMYYKDTTLSANTQYNYRVSMITTAGTGTASAEFNITTPAS